MARLETKITLRLVEIEWTPIVEVAMQKETTGVVAMVGEIVHQIEEIIIAKEAVLDPLVETVQVHRQIEMKGDHINALEKTVHFQEEKGELS